MSKIEIMKVSRKSIIVGYRHQNYPIEPITILSYTQMSTAQYPRKRNNELNFALKENNCIIIGKRET